MVIDVRTLVFCNALVTGCLAAGLLLYRASKKTYPGFSVWTTGTCFLAVGYLTLVLRGVTPLWPNILLVSASFALGALLLLANPQQGLFDPVAVQVTFFVAITILEVGIGLCFIMLNAVRLDQDLHCTRDNLQVALDDLQRSISEVKVLRGLLPICASCKKIRDDQGHWRPVEVYIRDRSEAQFTHGICADCAAKLYPSAGKI